MFHLNQDIALIFFFPILIIPRRQEFHTLNVVQTGQLYLMPTTSFQQINSLFVLPEGLYMYQTASWSTIWICQLNPLAYGNKDKVPPLLVEAHSTRSFNASWIIQN